jgi:hypothetical protein
MYLSLNPTPTDIFGAAAILYYFDLKKNKKIKKKLFKSYTGSKQSQYIIT